MTEDEGRDWINSRFGATAGARVTRFVDQVVAANEVQNLIARSTIDTIWTRHVVDSAQLALLAEHSQGRWLDIGTGAGFPGMVIALLGQHHVTMVEPRRRRVDFLRNVADVAGASIAMTIVQSDVQAYLSPTFDVISARAVAAIPGILRISRHLCAPTTRYVLPRGRSAHADLESVIIDWHGMFHVEQSLTDPASGIVIAEQVAQK